MRKQRRSHSRWDCKQDGYVISGAGTLNKKLMANETAGTRHCRRPVECSRSKQSHALRLLGNSQTMRKRIAPPRGVITIQPNTNRGLHSLQPNMSYKINLHNLLQNTRFNCNQNMLEILTTNILEIQSRNVNFNTIFDESRFGKTIDTSGYTRLASHTIAIRGGTKTLLKEERKLLPAKSIRSAKHRDLNALVPNNLFFALPLMNKFDLLKQRERNSQSLTKKLKCASSPHSNGGKYADFHIVTIKEPTALQSLI